MLQKEDGAWPFRIFEAREVNYPARRSRAHLFARVVRVDAATG
jgi:hypothetical protein